MARRRAVARRRRSSSTRACRCRTRPARATQGFGDDRPLDRWVAGDLALGARAARLPRPPDRRVLPRRASRSAPATIANSRARPATPASWLLIGRARCRRHRRRRDRRHPAARRRGPGRGPARRRRAARWPRRDVRCPRSAASTALPTTSARRRGRRRARRRRREEARAVAGRGAHRPVEAARLVRGRVPRRHAPRRSDRRTAVPRDARAGLPRGRRSSSTTARRPSRTNRARAMTAMTELLGMRLPDPSCPTAGRFP